MDIASLDEKRTRPSWTHPIRESALAPSRWVWILSLHPFDGPKKTNEVKSVVKKHTPAGKHRVSNKTFFSLHNRLGLRAS